MLTSPKEANGSNSLHARSDWPPVVVASIVQTGLNLMRDLERHGVRAVGVDCVGNNEGFQSSYGKAYLCPNPDTQPTEWVAFMIGLSTELGSKPVIIPAADIFVSALGKHVEALKAYFTFSLEAIAVQAALATKEQQYALAAKFGLPIPRSTYIRSRADLDAFVSVARFPCLLKPRHQREWDVLPEGNKLRGLKLSVAESPQQMLTDYAFTEAFRPEVMAQEIVAGGDDAKYCYLSVYGNGGRRLGYCVVHEMRAFPPLFGSASVVEPVVDEEVATTCHKFLSSVGYVGICEIEVKRDVRDGVVRLIEANPRYSVTADAGHYAGVDIGWLHYLDMIGVQVQPVEATRFDYRHICLRRDARTALQCVRQGTQTWGDILGSYRGRLEFFDFDWHDLRPSFKTVRFCMRTLAVTALRVMGLKR